MILRRSGIFFLIFALCFLFYKVGDAVFKFERDEIDVAKSSLSRGEWIEAQHLLEKYLMKEENPQKRWIAWKMILISSKRLNPDGRFYLEHLCAAYSEFKDNQEISTQLLRLMAETYVSFHMYHQAADAFLQLSRRKLPDKEAYSVYTRLAILEFSLGNYGIAEEACKAALALPISNTKLAEVNLMLSDMAIARGNMKEAEKIIADTLKLKDVDNKVYARLLFAYGDIFDMKGHHEDDAMKYFKESLPNHPNKDIVEFRIKSLNEKKSRNANSSVNLRNKPIKTQKKSDDEKDSN